MQRVRPLLALVLIVALLIGRAAPVLAQEEELPEGVTLDVIASGVAEGVPETADQLVLFRLTLEPGAVFPIVPEQGSVALAEVERGVLTSAVDGTMQVARADAEPGEEEAISGGETISLESGDSALYAPNLTGDIRNEGSEDVSLLIMEAAPSEMESGEEMMALPEGVAVELLAAGETPAMADGPVLLWIGQFILEPGAGMLGQAQGGAEIAFGEAGTFTLNPSEGPGLVVFRQLGSAVETGEEPVVESAATGDTITFTAGDAVYFPAGNALDISNAGDEPATATFGGIAPAPESP